MVETLVQTLIGLGILQVWLVRVLFRDRARLRVVVDHCVHDRKNLHEAPSGTAAMIGAGFFAIEVYAWNAGRSPALVEQARLVIPGQLDVAITEDRIPQIVEPNRAVLSYQTLGNGFFGAIEYKLRWWDLRACLVTVDGKRHWSKYLTEKPDALANIPPCMSLLMTRNRIRNFVRLIWSHLW